MSQKSRSRESQTWPTVEDVRHQLFYTWCAIFLAYVAIFLGSTLKERVEFPAATDAAWKVAYLVVPVLGAFAGYWFGQNQSSDDRERIDPKKRRVMFVLTGVLHGVVFLIITFGILAADFVDQEEPISYPERVDITLKFMLLIWSVSLLPVGWLLKGVQMPEPNFPPDAKP